MPPSRQDDFGSLFAHQLKTPTAVLRSTPVNLRRSLVSLIGDIVALRGITAPGGTAEATSAAEAFAALLESLPMLSEPAFVPTGLDEPRHIEEVIGRLRALGTEGDLGMAASSILRSGWDGRLESVAPLIRHDPERGLRILEGLARLRNALASMEASADRLAALAGVIGSLALPEQDAVTDPIASLTRAVAQWEGSLPPGVVLSLEAGETPPVRGRDELLAEIWSNLIGNAVQAVGGQGRLTIRTRVERGAPGRVIVSLHDDGPGIPPGHLDRIFEPGFTTHEDAGGSGLGLPIARALLERIGGTLAVTSGPQGTTFEVGLRIALAAAVQGVGG